MWCQELDMYIDIYTYVCVYIYEILSIIDVNFLYQFNLRLHHYYGLFSTFEKNVFQNFQKLAGLWLVGEEINHLYFMDLRRPRVARRSNVGLVWKLFRGQYFDIFRKQWHEQLKPYGATEPNHRFLSYL